MARTFNGTSDYLSYGAVPAWGTGRNFTVAARIWVGPSVAFGSLFSGGNQYFRLSFFSDSSNLAYEAGTDGAGGGGLLGFGPFLNQWVSIVCTVDNNATANIVIYINGVNDGSATSSDDMLGTSPDLRVGRDQGTNYLGARICEIARWNGLVLSQADITAHAKGVSPLQIRPDSLVFYDPLTGRLSPERDYLSSFTGTVNGTSFVDHPRVISPRGLTVGVPTAGGGGGNVDLTPGFASASLTGFAPSLVTTLTPGAASLSLTANAPSVTVGLTPGAGSLALTAFAPSLRTTLTPGAVSLSLTANAPRVGVGLTPGAASLALTAFAPTVTTNTLLVPGAASLALTAFAPTVTGPGTTLVPGFASLALTGFAPSLHETITPGAATLTLTPLTPVLGVGSQTLTPAPPTLTLTGLAPTVLVGYGAIYRHVEAAFNPAATTVLQVDMAAVSGTTNALLYDITAGSSVAGSAVSTSSTTFALHDSSALALVDAHDYRVLFGPPGSGQARAARLVCQP